MFSRGDVTTQRGAGSIPAPQRVESIRLPWVTLSNQRRFIWPVKEVGGGGSAMRLLCSETNHNSSPGAAFTITPVVLKQFLLPQKSQRPSGNKRGGFRSQLGSAAPVQTSHQVRLNAARGSDPQGNHTRRDSIFIDANAFKRENESKKKQPSALHTVSLWSQHLIVDWAFSYWMNYWADKMSKKMTPKSTKGIVSCAASERHEQNLLIVL